VFLPPDSRSYYSALNSFQSSFFSNATQVWLLENITS